jgi:RimJ/RimL family protein N-acetyltransferase/2-polyprenyl-3-methyl-5-hydroxy-6-metoxy-1,4-benzoquinol methylase
MTGDIISGQKMTTKTIRLTDGIVTIRKFRRSDKDRMAELANNEKISVNLRDAFPYPYAIADAETFIARCIRQNPVEIFAIEYHGQYVGNIGLHKQSDVYSKSAELGYFIGEPYWNRGITTRAVNLICEYGFKELDIVRIYSGVFEYNPASQRVLEKCGFEKEAICKNAVCKRGKIFDEIRYAKCRLPLPETGENKTVEPGKGKKQWYEALFEEYGHKYDAESFTQGTQGECDFLEKELGYDKSLKILDVGCGTGRHSIELTKRGYNVTGIDLSESQLRIAKEKAAAEKLKIKFLKHDARNLPFVNEFDVAVMLCEGGFPLMETDEMNFEILKNVTKSLKKRGRFIFTTLNGLFPLYHSVEQFCDSTTGEGNATYRSNTFNLMTFRDHNITEFEDDNGNKKTLDCNERYYVPSEITWLLKSLGFSGVEIFGAKLGAFSRNDKLTTEDFEMLVIAEK